MTPHPFGQRELDGHFVKHSAVPVVHWSEPMDATSWSPPKGSGRIWVGHPAIARGIIRLLRWLSRAKRRHLERA
jgi:hypothetical protein